MFNAGQPLAVDNLDVVYRSQMISHTSNSTENAGEKLVNFMVEPKKGTKWPKELPKFSSRPEAIAICKELCNRQYMHRSEKVAKGELEVRRTPLSGTSHTIPT